MHRGATTANGGIVSRGAAGSGWFNYFWLTVSASGRERTKKVIESSSGLRLRITNECGLLLTIYCGSIAAARCQSCLLAEFDDGESQSGLSLMWTRTV